MFFIASTARKVSCLPLPRRVAPVPLPCFVLVLISLFPPTQVAHWFAERSDMILILFDAHRLDVGTELIEVRRVVG